MVKWASFLVEMGLDSMDLVGLLCKVGPFLVEMVEDPMGLVGLLGKVGLLSSRDGSGPDGPRSSTPPVGSTIPS